MCRVALGFVGHIVKSGNPGERAPENGAEATKQAAEPNEGGQRHPRTTPAPRRRSEASWSGGAAERDSRPVLGEPCHEARWFSEMPTRSPDAPIPRSSGLLAARCARDQRRTRDRARDATGSSTVLTRSRVRASASHVAILRTPCPRRAPLGVLPSGAATAWAKHQGRHVPPWRAIERVKKSFPWIPGSPWICISPVSLYPGQFDNALSANMSETLGYPEISVEGGEKRTDVTRARPPESGRGSRPPSNRGCRSW